MAFKTFKAKREAITLQALARRIAKRRAAMTAAMKQYCSADLAKYCTGMQPGSTEARRCFFENRDSFSDNCKNALSKLMRGGHHRRGGGGGP